MLNPMHIYQISPSGAVGVADVDRILDLACIFMDVDGSDDFQLTCRFDLLTSSGLSF